MRNYLTKRIGVSFLIGYFFVCIVGFRFLIVDKHQSVPILSLITPKGTKEPTRISKGTPKESKIISREISNEQMTTVPRQYPILKAYINIDGNYLWTSNQTALQLHTFPNASRKISCHGRKLNSFPIIDSYPEGDSYLPWIHDVFPNKNGTMIHIIAQNRRRCHTGKNNIEVMKSLEGQIALMQPLAVERHIVKDLNGFRNNTTYHLTSHKDADKDGKETRFLCRFKIRSASTPMFKESSHAITLSRYPFNYEYIALKKGKRMFLETGKEMENFWLSSLEFHCPVPSHITLILNGTVESGRENPLVFLDIATIRTPVRRSGQQSFGTHSYGSFDAKSAWGSNLALPSFDASGRWENIPICPPTSYLPISNESTVTKVSQNNPSGKNITKKKTFQLVACTWTSAIHNRRGDARTIEDGVDRLLEWITFHLLAGFDHIFVYDNSAANTNVTLKEVTDKFSPGLVTHIHWPCKICNNNRPAHNDPGERSSQYAAEASCRSRFGTLTDWMAFMDPDEYFVPMGKYNNWKEILAHSYQKEELKILKFRSTRARPRKSLMNTYTSSKECLLTNNCLAHKSNETFLKTYNCEYIKSPKPERFQRAMKQIYRPDFVLSHFIHYSTVTKDLAYAETIKIRPDKKEQIINERFVDEINEGVLVHAKTTPPDETIGYVEACRYKSKDVCQIGLPCPNDLPFSDATHKDGFQDTIGTYCNCWVNRNVENLWVPKLEDALNEIRIRGHFF